MCWVHSIVPSRAWSTSGWTDPSSGGERYATAFTQMFAQNGFSAVRNSFVQTYGGEAMDAHFCSFLKSAFFLQMTLALQERGRSGGGTAARRAGPTVSDCSVDDGVGGEEGAFLVCSLAG
jgi:hypothetical protein